MSSFTEIQEAITELPESERRALSTWLASRTPPQITSEDEICLLRSLDEAVRDLDSGKGVPLHAARKLVRKWAGK